MKNERTTIPEDELISKQNNVYEVNLQLKTLTE